MALASMTITGDKELAERLKKISESLSSKIPGVIDKDVERFSLQANVGYQNAMYVGHNDVVVSVNKPDDRTWELNASGTSVLFIEYGSGIVFKHDSEFGDFGRYTPTSWSATHGRWLTNPKRLYRFQGWWPLPHPDTRRPVGWTQGNPSANVMYDVSKTARMIIPRDAKSELEKALK